jgi:Ca2+-dependent lipid-binding protein
MPAESVNVLGTLVVVVLKAQNLIDNHTFYKQDPYAQVTYNGNIQKTPVDPKGGQHPVWDTEIRFPILSDVAGTKKVLSVACYSQEKKQDMLLGEGEVDISETLRSGEFDGTLTV